MVLIKNIFEKFILFGAFIFAMIAPSLAFAEEVPNIEGLLDAISSKNYPLLVAFSLSIIVFFVRKSTNLFPKKSIPYVVLVLGVVSGAATGIIMEDTIWWHGLIKGLLEGLAAGLMSMGFWSAGLKNILRVPENDQNA